MYTCYDALSSRKLDEDIIPRGPWGFICGSYSRPMGYILECVYMYLVGSYGPDLGIRSRALRFCCIMLSPAAISCLLAL